MSTEEFRILNKYLIVVRNFFRQTGGRGVVRKLPRVNAHSIGNMNPILFSVSFRFLPEFRVKDKVLRNVGHMRGGMV
jgi:hypothetical protein